MDNCVLSFGMCHLTLQHYMHMNKRCESCSGDICAACCDIKHDPALKKKKKLRVPALMIMAFVQQILEAVLLATLLHCLQVCVGAIYLHCSPGHLQNGLAPKTGTTGAPLVHH